MSKETELKGLDTIITLLRVTLKDRERIENDLKVVSATIEHLQAQAHAALEGTGLSLSFVEDKSKLVVTEWRDLKIDDQIRVKVALDEPVANQKWETRTVVALESEDYDGTLCIKVDSPLADESRWVRVYHDEWEFISRP